jgi:predicted transcriptional regulator
MAKSGFRDAVDEVSKKKPLVREKKNLILDLYDLRSVFAHRSQERYIADVKDFAFDEIDNILNLVDDPPTAEDLFAKDVYACARSQKLEDVLMVMRDQEFTHTPVYGDGDFAGVLTETAVVHWFAEKEKG